MKTFDKVYNLKAVAITLLFAVSVSAGCRNTGAKTYTSEDNGIPVRVSNLEWERISIPIYVSGNIKASKVSRLSFKTGGIVKSIFADAGDRVTQGQILAKLDLKEIQEQVNQAKIGLEKAQRDYERVLALYRDTVATLEQFQNIKSALDVAKANMNIAEYNLKFSTITAPSDGVILKKFFDENEIVNVGMPIFYFASVEDSWQLLVGISDKDVVKLTLGDRATITTDAYPEKELDCVVSKIANAPGEYTGLYEVELSVMDSEVELKHGFFAKGIIQPSQYMECFSLPVDAIQEGIGNRISFYSVSDDMEVAIKQETHLLLMNGEKAYINTEDLNEDMLVIVENQRELKHLNRISIVKSNLVASAK